MCIRDRSWTPRWTWRTRWRLLERQPGDALEVKLGRYVIDLVRDDLLIEIQTRHLYALRPKLRRLLDDGRRIHLVHPLPAERWIVREDAAGRPVSRRKSPRHAAVHDLSLIHI